MTAENSNFHSMLLLTLFKKSLFIKDFPMKCLSRSREAKVLESGLFSELNCVMLGKSLNFSAFISFYYKGLNNYFTGLLCEQ